MSCFHVNVIQTPVNIMFSCSKDTVYGYLYTCTPNPAQVLGGLVDGVLPLDEDSASVVRDTLAILTCKEIKLTSLRRNVGEELADEGDHVGAAMATAQTKIISQIVKRNVIENLVPIVISAKHLVSWDWKLSK